MNLLFDKLLQVGSHLAKLAEVLHGVLTVCLKLLPALFQLSALLSLLFQLVLQLTHTTKITQSAGLSRCNCVSSLTTS